MASSVAALPSQPGRQVSFDAEESASSYEEGDSTSSEERKLEKAEQIRKGFKHPAWWMLALGFVLAGCAGMVDVIVFEEVPGTFVSHHTGSLAKTAMDLEGVHMVRKFDPQPASEHLLLILSFTFGAFLCGLVIDKNTVHFGGNSFYSVALIGNSALLFAAIVVLPGRGAAYLSAMACGLQNAMCTSHFTAVVRTTHVTGSFTDIGSTSGRIVAILLRRRCWEKIKHVDKAEIWVDSMKLQILLLLCTGFFLGGIVGAYLDSLMGKFSLAVPASFTGAIGFAYFFVTHFCKEKVTEYEDKQRAEHMKEVEDHILRAHEVLSVLSGPCATSDIITHRSRTALSAIDCEVDHALEIVRDFTRALVDRQWTSEPR